jgi:hypothetical protein
MRLYQPINTSIEEEPTHSITTSGQATEGAPCQPLPWEEEPDHVQINDWDDEAKVEAAVANEKELAKVQQENREAPAKTGIHSEKVSHDAMCQSL